MVRSILTFRCAIMLSRLNRFSLLALILLFLTAQYSVAVHTAEHPFHKHVVSCDVFMAAQNDQACQADVFLPSVERQAIEPFIFFSASISLLPQPLFQARAPPLSA